MQKNLNKSLKVLTIAALALGLSSCSSLSPYHGDGPQPKSDVLAQVIGRDKVKEPLLFNSFSTYDQSFLHKEPYDLEYDYSQASVDYQGGPLQWMNNVSPSPNTLEAMRPRAKWGLVNPVSYDYRPAELYQGDKNFVASFYGKFVNPEVPVYTLNNHQLKINDYYRKKAVFFYSASLTWEQKKDVMLNANDLFKAGFDVVVAIRGLANASKADLYRIQKEIRFMEKETGVALNFPYVVDPRPFRFLPKALVPSVAIYADFEANNPVRKLEDLLPISKQADSYQDFADNKKLLFLSYGLTNYNAIKYKAGLIGVNSLTTRERALLNKDYKLYPVVEEDLIEKLKNYYSSKPIAKEYQTDIKFFEDNFNTLRKIYSERPLKVLDRPVTRVIEYSKNAYANVIFAIKNLRKDYLILDLKDRRIADLVAKNKDLMREYTKRNQVILLSHPCQEFSFYACFNSWTPYLGSNILFMLPHIDFVVKPEAITTMHVDQNKEKAYITYHSFDSFIQYLKDNTGRK